jgi:Fe-S-cluster-containing hydrogenase component 2
VQFLIEQRLGEATDALLIDNALCVGCNNCETACAETHNGLSALDRSAGQRHGTLHVPSACRHCETPLCLGDCPTDSIRRAVDGAIYIDDNCTGCGHCERNCPFDAIRMAAPPERKPNLLLWMLFGWGSGPGEDRSRAVAPSPGNRHAVKCDLCHGAESGPACVNACPTGAAMRVNPAAFIRSTLRP